MGLAGVIACGLLACVMLFASPVLGVADDGTVTDVMLGAGLDFPEGTQADDDYFVRTYQWKAAADSGYQSGQTLLIYLAKALDYGLTGDKRFDIRFLGGIYLALFLPAIYLLITGAAERVPKRSQKIVLLAAVVFMFADAGYLTYFNSFYPEAPIGICLIYMAGAALKLGRGKKNVFLWLFVFAAAGIALCFVRRYCFLAGFIGALFCFWQLYEHRDPRWRATVFLSGTLMILGGFLSFFMLADDFNQADKLHAMTRGVLLQAENPEETLADFGIDPSYSLLTDISAYDLYPVTDGYGEALEEGFYDRYDTWELVKYYLRHPGQMLSMIDLGVKANLEVRKEACGNYEQEAGRPAGALSLFWAGYSMLKNRSAPKTVGYLIILAVVPMALTAGRFSLRRTEHRKNRLFAAMILFFTVFTLSETVYCILRCGETALIQYNGQLGIVMDLLFFFLITEILDRLNIL